MRPILCSGHSQKFRGKGTSRVMRGVLFHFCAACWRNRRKCELQMDAATRPMPVPAEGAA